MHFENKKHFFENIPRFYDVITREQGSCLLHVAKQHWAQAARLSSIFKHTSLPVRLVLLKAGCEQFAAHCVWNKLSSGQWVRLLCRQPRYLPKAPKHLWPRLGGAQWIALLRAIPELEQQFVTASGARTMTTGDWCRLLAARPQFAAHCPWNTLPTSALVRLLASTNVAAEWTPLDWMPMGVLMELLESGKTDAVRRLLVRLLGTGQLQTLAAAANGPARPTAIAQPVDLAQFRARNLSTRVDTSQKLPHE